LTIFPFFISRFQTIGTILIKRIRRAIEDDSSDRIKIVPRNGSHSKADQIHKIVVCDYFNTEKKNKRDDWDFSPDDFRMVKVEVEEIDRRQDFL